MNNIHTALFSRCWLVLVALVTLSCSTVKEADVLDRKAVPAVDYGVPDGTSEIRELKFHKTAREAGHEVLHLRGILYTKSGKGDNTRITPCGGCVIRLSSASDTTITANLTTETDGFFSFNGKLLPYTFVVSGPGMNSLVIEGMESQKEGITTLKIVQASGNASERFRITKSGDLYTWTRVQ